MKLAINHTLILSDEQRTINGELLLGKDLKPLFIQALEDLAKGETVYLAQYGFDRKLDALLSTTEAKQRAFEHLCSDLGVKAVRVRVSPMEDLEAAGQDEEECRFCDGQGGTVGVSDNTDIDPCPACGGTGRPASVGSPAEISPTKVCLRCNSFMDAEEVGMCENCLQPLMVDCRALEVEEAVAELGPLPREIRGGVDDEGVKIPMPYLCKSCIKERVEQLNDDGK